MSVDIVFDGANPVRGLTWIALPGNPNYLGRAAHDVIARQVIGAVGPSGANTEYVLALDRALREDGIDDPHVAAVAARVRALQAGVKP